MHKLLLLSALMLLLSGMSFGQNKKPKESYYAFDENWKAAEMKNAKFISYVLNYNDTTYEWNNYNYAGPLLNIETYKDKDATIEHGYFAWFDEKGRIDSNGYVFEKKKHGKWYYFTDTLSVMIYEEFDMGILIKRADYRDSLPPKKPLALLPGEYEAAFKGGDKGWRTYLEKNFRTPTRAEKLGIGGQTITLFTIDTGGNITDLKLHRSVELSIDRESLRLIQEGPKWIPAEQAGRKVRAYRKQPITFAN